MPRDQLKRHSEAVNKTPTSIASALPTKEDAIAALFTGSDSFVVIQVSLSSCQIWSPDSLSTPITPMTALRSTEVF
jgi:hypothetical protein